MHKPGGRDKKGSPNWGRGHTLRSQKPLNVKDLLEKSRLVSREIPQLSDQQEFWSKLLRDKLDPALFGAITAVIERDDRLTVSTGSAEWAARLRFALAELWPELHAERGALRAWVVRVQPAAAESRRART